jgi:hypothetical protein
VSVLANQHDLLIWREGNNIDPLSSIEEIEIVSFAGPWRTFMVFAEREDTTRIDGFGIEALPGFEFF